MNRQKKYLETIVSRGKKLSINPSVKSITVLIIEQLNS